MINPLDAHCLMRRWAVRTREGSGRSLSYKACHLRRRGIILIPRGLAAVGFYSHRLGMVQVHRVKSGSLTLL